MALRTRRRNSGSVSDILTTWATEGDEASAESHFLEPDLRTTRQIAIVRVARYLPQSTSSERGRLAEYHPSAPSLRRSRDGRRKLCASPQYNADCNVTLPDRVECDIGFSLLSKEAVSG